MTPRDFHTLATELAVNTRPASTRSAVSRAYYAAHHACAESLRLWASAEEIEVSIPRNGTAHRTVIDLLHEVNDQELTGMARLLGQLQSARLNADYDLNQSSVEQRATWAVNTAQTVIDLVPRVFSTPGSRRHSMALALKRRYGGS